MANGRFWAFLFQPSAGAAGCCLLTGSGAVENVPKPAAVVFEIFNERELWTMVISVADSSDLSVSVLHCIFAVSNCSKECDELTMLGFPIVEGDIKRTGNVLTVDTAFYPRRMPGKPAKLTMGRLLEVSTNLWDLLDEMPSSSRLNVPKFNPPYRTLQF